MKLLKKITFTSTFTFLLCITSTTTTHIPTIVTEKNIETSQNTEQNYPDSIESETQPFADDEDDELKESPLS